MTANANFKVDDVVYQGVSYESASAYGIVSEWSNATNQLIIVGAQGQFTTNSSIHSVATKASCNVASFDATPIKLVNIHVVPDPTTANPGDDYGYTTIISEWPSTNSPGESITSDSMTAQTDSTALTADIQ